MSRLEDSVSGHNGQSSFGAIAAANGFAVGVVTLAGPIGVLDFAVWQLRRSGAVVGDVFAELTAFTGTLGTDQVPSTILATSDNVDASLITADANGEPVQFDFSGAERIALTGLTEYMLTVNGSGLTVADLAVRRTDPNVDGLGRSQLNGSWAFGAADRVMNFELWSADIPPDPGSAGITNITDIRAIA